VSWGEQFDEPCAHVKDAADTILRKHLSELGGIESRNSPCTIGAVKINNPIFTMHIAIAPSETTLLLHSQFLESLGEVESAHLSFKVHSSSGCWGFVTPVVSQLRPVRNRHSMQHHREATSVRQARIPAMAVVMLCAP
jgi:hypothetical protein